VDAAGGRLARLRGWRRGWGVAMDNAVTIPGYKCFLAPDGSRPDVCVGFLDIDEDAEASVNGVCVPVDADALTVLDARERNYRRVDVTAAVEPAMGPTWTYVGLAASRGRYAEAAEAGRLVVASEYAAAVEAGFRALGQWEEFTALTADHAPPVRKLRRVDLP
jgi:Gamma-glutamyl cyclotransferase, AIG2-like